MDPNHPLAPPASPLSPVEKEGVRAVAVAIQADPATPDAPPRIVAAGRGKVAAQILELAYAKGVKVREDPDLAQLLVQLELDTPIPSEAIVAVAEILAKVYEANGASPPGPSPVSAFVPS